MNVLPNGVKTPTTADLIDPQTLLTELATSFSDAIGGLGVGKRQPRIFRVENQTEKATLAAAANLADGDRVFVADTAWWELRVGGAWKLWETTKAVPWPFAHTGITIGDGIESFTYMVSGDLVHITGSLRFGTSSSVTSGGYLVLPFMPDSPGSLMALGIASVQSSGTVLYQGLVTTWSNNQAAIFIDNGASGGALSNIAPGVPLNYSNGVVLGLDISYRRSM